MLAGWNRVCIASAIPALLFSSAASTQIKGEWVDPPSDLSAPQASDLEVKRLAIVETNSTQSVPSPAQEIAARPTDEPKPSSEAVQSMPEGPSADFSSLQLTMRNWKLPPPIIAKSEAAQPTRESAPPPPLTTDRTVQQSLPTRRVNTREEDARNLAQNYLSVWSASNYQTLQATPGFYGSEVRFHGRSMSTAALLAEKRRFVQRWPNRRYRYEPGAMGVRCNSAGTSCIVRSTFAFDASNAKLGRRSRGVGAHELVVNFAGNRPVIASENSRVLRRGSRL
jgi:hypothetical protein